MIAEKLLQIKHNIDTYSIYPEKVKLLVVSKRQPIEKMRECLLQGHTLFGENFVQEAQHKKELLQEGASFHLIGNLQKNKIKYCPQLFSFIHTLDNSVTAKLLNQAFVKSDQILQVLLQVNLSLEETKAGVVSFDNLQKLTEDVLELSNLKLVGLMSIGNPQAKAKETQALFSLLR